MKSPFLCNKQYITVDNSYILLYTVCEVDKYAHYYKQQLNDTNL